MQSPSSKLFATQTSLKMWFEQTPSVSLLIRHVEMQETPGEMSQQYSVLISVLSWPLVNLPCVCHYQPLWLIWLARAGTKSIQFVSNSYIFEKSHSVNWELPNLLVSFYQHPRGGSSEYRTVYGLFPHKMYNSGNTYVLMERKLCL